jgi:poly-gamma-glutamate synthesis protein (capsule biosynthesis protein)
MLHSGVEYRPRPVRAQRVLAQAAVDAGATLVIEHGPHVLQGYHQVGGTLVAYSLGNFVFARFDGAPNDTAILDVTLTHAGVSSLDWIPMVIQGGVPRPAVGADAVRIMSRLEEL